MDAVISLTNKVLDDAFHKLHTNNVEKFYRGLERRASQLGDVEVLQGDIFVIKKDSSNKEMTYLSFDDSLVNVHFSAGSTSGGILMYSIKKDYAVPGHLLWLRGTKTEIGDLVFDALADDGSRNSLANVGLADQGVDAVYKFIDAHIKANR